MHLDGLTGIPVFVAAAKTRSFSRAAEQLGLTKSAVGKTIARLEARLGFKLFHRTTRVTTLTTDGEAYFEACRSALEQIADAQSTLASKHQILAGKVHIDMPVAFGRQVLLPVLMEIVRPHPELSLTLTFSDARHDLLQDGVDLAIRFGALPDSGDLVARRLVSQRRVICGAPAYFASHDKPRKPEDLQRHRCIVGTLDGPPSVWYVNDGATDLRMTPPATHRFSDGEAIVDAVVAGLGLAQLPHSMLRDPLSEGRLIEVLSEYAPSEVEVHAMWPRQAQLNPRVRYIIDRLHGYAESGALK